MNNTFQRVNADLVALFEVGKLKLKVERHRVFDGVVLNYEKTTKVEGYLTSTEPKSITFGNIVLRSGKVGYA